MPVLSLLDFPGEVILGIAEQMDIDSLRNLMDTSKEFHSLLKSYESSICQYRMRRLPPPPNDQILSSDDVIRRTLEHETFEGIAELEQRESRIHKVLYSSYVNMAQPPFLQPLEVAQQENFAVMIKRALRHCDAMADLAANVPGAAITEQQYHTIATGGNNTRASREEIADLFLNFKVRPAQIEYIQQLSAEDLAGLYLTVMTLSAGFIQANDWVRWDPNYPEQITVFEECVLRHGTWFLWTEITKTGGLTPQVAVLNRMLRAGFAELIDWETGKADMKPGLRMTLLGAAMTKLAEAQDNAEDESDSEAGVGEEEYVDVDDEDADFPPYANPVISFLFQTMNRMLRGVAIKRA